jgi:hypothetical protein
MANDRGEEIDIFFIMIASARHIWRALAALSTDMSYIAARQIFSCNWLITGLVSLPRL